MTYSPSAAGALLSGDEPLALVAVFRGRDTEVFPMKRTRRGFVAESRIDPVTSYATFEVRSGDEVDSNQGRFFELIVFESGGGGYRSQAGQGTGNTGNVN